jgi:hypothetical protein
MGQLAALAPSLESTRQQFAQMDLRYRKRAKSFGGDHEKAEHA